MRTLITNTFMKTLLIIGLGGVFGSISRYLTTLFFNKYFISHLFLGTFTVNIIGCFLLGILYGTAQHSLPVSDEWRKFIGIGFCGSFTTFSSFSFENAVLIQQGQMGQMFLYLSGSILIGLASTFTGIYFVKLF